MACSVNDIFNRFNKIKGESLVINNILFKVETDTINEVVSLMNLKAKRVVMLRKADLHKRWTLVNGKLSYFANNSVNGRIESIVMAESPIIITKAKLQ
jgi:hypothetical protein